MEIASEDRSFILILLRDIDVFETTRYSSGEHIVANQLSDNPPESSVCGFAHKTALDSLSDSRVAVRRHYSRSASLQAQSLRHNGHEVSRRFFPKLSFVILRVLGGFEFF